MEGKTLNATLLNMMREIRALKIGQQIGTTGPVSSISDETIADIVNVDNTTD